MIKVQSGDHDSLGNSDLSYVTSVGEIIIALTHVKYSPGFVMRKHAGFRVVQLILKWDLFMCVTSLLR